MIIKVVGKNTNVSFDTKDRNGQPLHIQGTSVFYLRERRGVEGYASDKCFVSRGVEDPFQVGKDYEVYFNEYGKIDLSHVTLV